MSNQGAGRRKPPSAFTDRVTRELDEGRHLVKLLNMPNADHSKEAIIQAIRFWVRRQDQPCLAKQWEDASRSQRSELNEIANKGYDTQRDKNVYDNTIDCYTQHY